MISFPPIEVHLPLLDELWELEPELRNQFPDVSWGRLQGLGFCFAERHELNQFDIDRHYDSTPVNSVAIAWTGMDGDSFSFVVREGCIDGNSPVVFNAPFNFGIENCIVAKDFRSFLQLGLLRGFADLTEFGWWPEGACEAYGSLDWVRPDDGNERWDRYLIENEQRRILDFVGESLKLVPTTLNAQEFQFLQDQFMPQIEYSDDYEIE